MKIFPAIDLFGGSAVRLFKGDYNQMTIYSNAPEEIAKDFEKQGAEFLHLVDLEGAKNGDTPNVDTIEKIVKSCNLFVEVGGGIRSMNVIEKYLAIGVSRVILGTAAVTDETFLMQALSKYGDKIAVGVDIKDGLVAIKGWTEKSNLDGVEFCRKLETLGVKTVICTDVSKDGAMQGTNHALYKTLKEKTNLNVIASGGVSTIEDVKSLNETGVYGAIIGKAYYIGAIKIADAVKVAK